MQSAVPITARSEEDHESTFQPLWFELDDDENDENKVAVDHGVDLEVVERLPAAVGEEVVVFYGDESNKENIDFAMIPEAFYVGNDLADRPTTKPLDLATSMQFDDVMDIDIAVIQRLGDVPLDKLERTEPMELIGDDQMASSSQSPISRGHNDSVSGPEITSCHVATVSVSVSGTNSLHEQSYPVLSETTDSEVSTKPHPEDQYFSDHHFHLLAEQIMDEADSTDHLLSTASMHHNEHRLLSSFQPFRRSESSQSTNIWRETPSPSSIVGGRKCTQTLAGLLMNGLEPISTQFAAS